MKQDESVDSEYVCQANFEVGEYLFYKELFSQAESYFQQAIKLTDRISDSSTQK